MDIYSYSHWLNHSPYVFFFPVPLKYPTFRELLANKPCAYIIHPNDCKIVRLYRPTTLPTIQTLTRILLDLMRERVIHPLDDIRIYLDLFETQIEVNRDLYEQWLIENGSS
jgi:hypothetical protein